MDKQWEIEAPAKVNLYLEVGGRRDDGYHDLCSLAVSVSLFDRLVIRKKPGHGGLKTRFLPGPFFPKRQITKLEALVQGEDHSLAKAWKWWSKHREKPLGAWEVQVIKNIPLGAGLAGGTTDGAALLKALRSEMEQSLPKGDFVEALGSDMAFCLHGGPAWILGRGERIEKASLPDLELPQGLPLCLAAPPSEVSSRRAYERISSERCSFFHNFRTLGLISLEELWEKEVSPFWWLALREHSEVASLAREMTATGARHVSITGSGPTLFGVFDTKEGAQVAKECLRRKGFWACDVGVV